MQLYMYISFYSLLKTLKIWDSSKVQSTDYVIMKVNVYTQLNKLVVLRGLTCSFGLWALNIFSSILTYLFLYTPHIISIFIYLFSTEDRTQSFPYGMQVPFHWDAHRAESFIFNWHIFYKFMGGTTIFSDICLHCAIEWNKSTFNYFVVWCPCEDHY